MSSRIASKIDCKSRQTLNYTDEKNQFALPWYWVPADLEKAKIKGKTKPLYELKTILRNY